MKLALREAVLRHFDEGEASQSIRVRVAGSPAAGYACRETWLLEIARGPTAQSFSLMRRDN